MGASKLAPVNIAECIMAVAESRSVDALSAACLRAVGELTGSQMFGLYMLQERGPKLLCSRHAPEGFLHDYLADFAHGDPMLNSVLSNGQVIDGPSQTGEDNWRQSAMFDLLRRWGLQYNMCGPLRYGDRTVGLIYTATSDAAKPYSPRLRGNMGLICRAASVALSLLMESSRLGDGVISRVANVPLPAPASTGIPFDDLPPRAAQVAFRICNGETNKEIARAMGISHDTVKEHVTRLCNRFHAHNRTELVARLLS